MQRAIRPIVHIPRPCGLYESGHFEPGYIDKVSVFLLTSVAVSWFIGAVLVLGPWEDVTSLDSARSRTEQSRSWGKPLKESTVLLRGCFSSIFNLG